jgi:hypothetical protein
MVAETRCESKPPVDNLLAISYRQMNPIGFIVKNQAEKDVLLCLFTVLVAEVGEPGPRSGVEQTCTRIQARALGSIVCRQSE